MTDQNTNNAIADEAVERVGDAIFGAIGEPVFASDGSTDMYDTDIDLMATAAIQAHIAYLWERSRQPDVVEAAAKEIHGLAEWLLVDKKLVSPGVAEFAMKHPDYAMKLEQVATAALTAALTLLLGPRPEGDTNAD